MAKGICIECGKKIGGMFKSNAYECPACKKCFCKDCCEKIGLLKKKPVCPNCGRKLKKM